MDEHFWHELEGRFMSSIFHWGIELLCGVEQHCATLSKLRRQERLIEGHSGSAKQRSGWWMGRRVIKG